MGTNFYWRTPQDIADNAEGLHIGKWANGGITSLRGHFRGNDPEITSWQAWKLFLEQHRAEGIITAEHGITYEVEEFVSDVESGSRRARPDWHRMVRAEPKVGGTWDDREGYRFHGSEFC